MAKKIPFQGTITSVQPRIRLNRSFDERSHTYLGYALRINGQIGEETRAFWVGIGKAAQAKNAFQSGVQITGECLQVADPRMESVEFYKAAKLAGQDRAQKEKITPPPWSGISQDLEVYRERGHRRLAARTYENSCTSCLWGCKMAVEMIIDQWNETFCYGPKSCPFYKAGPTRKVPGRKGMSWEEDDWVDEEATSHRGPDE